MLPYTKAEIIPWKVHCIPCGDTGKVLALKKDENALPYAFRCPYCYRGREAKVCFETWGNKHEKGFELLTGVQGL